MRINHLMINSTDISESTRFYCEFLGFSLSRKFNDGAGDSQVVHKEVQGRDFDLLIIPAGAGKISQAQHIAFEVDSLEEFESLFQKANAIVMHVIGQCRSDSCMILMIICALNL